jgi:hypothetical protein
MNGSILFILTITFSNLFLYHDEIILYYYFKYNWITSGEPQFLYFFLDTTLGKGTSIALIGLLAVLSIFYSIFVLVDDVMSLLGGGVSVHLAVVITVALLTCRFKD